MYLDGHFVTMRARDGDEDAVLEAAVDDDVAAGTEEVGHEALVEDGHGRRALHVAEPEAQAGAVRVSGDGLQHDAR